MRKWLMVKEGGVRVGEMDMDKVEGRKKGRERREKKKDVKGGRGRETIDLYPSLTIK